MTSGPGASVAQLVEGESGSVHEAAPTPLRRTGAWIVLVTARRRKRATLKLVRCSAAHKFENYCKGGPKASRAGQKMSLLLA